MTTHNLIRPFLIRLMQISASGSVIEFVAVISGAARRARRRIPYGPSRRKHLQLRQAGGARFGGSPAGSYPNGPDATKREQPLLMLLERRVAMAGTRLRGDATGCLPEIHPADGRRGCKIKRRNPLWWARCNRKDTFKGCALGLVRIIQEA
jgi:hypothetical protein